MKSQRRFPPASDSVAAAREFVAECLTAFSTDTVSVVELLASELVTNAVLHAESEFEVDVITGPTGTIRVEVTDFGGGEPVQRGPAPSEPRGRGLQIVDALATRWGVVREESAEQTTTWFEFDDPPPAA
jgi:anti-sigma regulatory factor (Ser/Thr protein kinase)